MESTNNSKLKELFNNGLVYGISSSFQSISGFILLPLLTNYISTDKFGVYSLILLMSTFSNAIFYLGASSALGRFYYDIDTDKYRSNITTISFLITLSGAFLLIFLSFTFASKISLLLFYSDEYKIEIICSMVATALTFLTTFLLLILRYEKKATSFLIFTVTSTILNFFVSYILLIKYNAGMLSPILGILFSNATIFTILIIKKFKTLSLNFDSKYFYPILTFGLQTALTGLLYYILDWIDRIILKNLLSLSDVGIYSLGYRIASIINMLFVLPFSLIWAPMRMQYSKAENNDQFVTKVISYYTIIGILFISFSIIVGDIFFDRIFKNDSYIPALKIFPIIMFSLFIYGYQNILDFGIYLHKKVYIYILVSIIGIFLNIILNYILIRLTGTLGAAYSTLLTYFSIIFLIYIISNKYHKINLDYNRVLFPVFYFFIFYFLSIFYDNIYIKLFSFIIGIFLIIKFWLNRDEKNILIKKFNFKNL